MLPRPRSVALAAVVLSLLVAGLWLFRPQADRVRTGAPVAARTEAGDPEAAAKPAEISRSPAPAGGYGVTASPKLLTSRLAQAKLSQKPVEARKLGPANGLPVEVAEGRVMERRDSSRNGGGRFRRATVYQTDFKYPFLRVEQEVAMSPRGEEIVTAQLVMVADHLLVK